MYYFYVNFPTFREGILVHNGACGRCNNGMGLHNAGSSTRGFWAGPFQTRQDAHTALASLMRKFRNPPNGGDCNGCLGN